jgi:coiled-coil domain-containing protein 151
MLLKLQEVDEMTAEIQEKRRAAKPLSVPLPDLILSGNISTEQIVRMLEEKVKVGMIASGQMGDGLDSGLISEEEEEVAEIKPIEPKKEEEDEAEPIEKIERMKSPSLQSFAIDEKPAAYPQVYSSLITGRSTGLVSASPGAGQGMRQSIYFALEINFNPFFSLRRGGFGRGSRCSQQIFSQTSSKSHSRRKISSKV